MGSWKNCPGNQSIKFYVDVNNSAGVANKIFYSGYLDVSKKVPGPMEFVIDVNRCDIEMKKCEQYPGLQFTGFCQKLKDKNAFYYGALSKIDPPFECPVLAQRYNAANSIMDLTALQFLPISGYKWLVTMKIISGEAKNKEMAFCILAEMKITRSGRKRN